MEIENTRIPVEELKDDQVWLNLPYEVRLAVARHIFSQIAKEGPCSYRRLIYNRLQFKPDAYCELYYCGGMDITNAMHDADSQARNYDAKTFEQECRSETLPAGTAIGCIDPEGGAAVDI